MYSRSDAETFVKVVTPAIKAGDARALADLVLSRWTPGQLCPMLEHPKADVRRVVAVVLGLVGDRAAMDGLTRALHDDDPQVNQMAEHSLWAIWFRSGSNEAARPFKQGVQLLVDENYESALVCFNRALRIDPTFTEAFNQCAIAHFFLGEYHESLVACSTAVKRVNAHFGAIANMGHCYTQMGQLAKALRCYRKALRINPRMSAVQQAIERLQQRYQDVNDESGEYLGEYVPV